MLGWLKWRLRARIVHGWTAEVMLTCGRERDNRSDSAPRYRIRQFGIAVDHANRRVCP